MKKLLLGAAVVGALCFGAVAGPAHATVDAANALTYYNLPTPTTNGRGIAAYSKFDADFKIEQSSPDSSNGYFWNHAFSLVNDTNQTSGYIGVQTRLAPNNGKGFIFSLFDATGCTPDTNGGGVGATCYTGTENGRTFYSLHYDFNWTVGHTYRMSVSRGYYSNYAFNNITKGTITDVTTSTSYYLGTLYAPATWKGFTFNDVNHEAVSWTEQYWPASFNACTDIPVVKAVVYPPNYYGLGTTFVGTPMSYSTQIDSTHGCTNSAVNSIGSNQYREIVGATS